MDKFIKVYDNLLPLEFQNYIENELLYNTSYRFSSNIINGNPNDYFPSFGENFYPNSIPNLYFHTYLNILYKACSIENILIIDLLQFRTYFHLPIKNQTLQPPHTDLSTPHMVCLYYVNDSDGDTIFYKEDGITEIKRISPKKGRIVIFDGLIKHSGSFPKDTHRLVLNFDFIGEYLDKLE